MSKPEQNLILPGILCKAYSSLETFKEPRAKFFIFHQSLQGYL